MKSMRLLMLLSLVLFVTTVGFAQTFTATHTMIFTTGPLGASSSGFAFINIPDPVLVTSLKVRVNVTFPADDDLEIRLVSPASTSQILTSGNGVGANFTNTVFWDGAAQPITTGTPPFTGFYQPMQPLSDFTGEAANGNWVLEVQNFGPQSGSIDNFEIELNMAPLPVELNSFNANATDSRVQLNWRTESETNNARFNLYRSTTVEQRGELIAEIQGQGTSANQHNYSYTDSRVVNGTTYYYRLADVDLNGVEYLHGIVVTATPNQQTSVAVPGKFALHQNYPNPFNPSTSITFKLAKAGHVSLTIYDILGNEIERLVEDNLAAGEHSVTYNAANLSSGAYFYKLSTNGFTTTKRMVLAK